MEIGKTNNAAPQSSLIKKRGLVVSIRSKGLIVFGVLFAYSFLLSAFAFHQKNLLQQEFQEIQTSLETENVLKQAELSSFHAVMAILSNIDSPDYASNTGLIQMHYQSLLDAQKDIEKRLPQDKFNMDSLNLAWGNLEQGVTREKLNRLSMELIKAKDDVALVLERTQQRREAISKHYLTQSDTVAITLFLLGFLGLGLLGALTGLFFRRLTDDIGLLQDRALAIVNGYRGEPVPITRHDEVGQLMVAVNDMAHTLDLRENELLLERQKYFHQEKMAAIGTLAAGVAHEIGNPIAAISGIAQAMLDLREEDVTSCGTSNCMRCKPELIVEQTKRLSAITREISQFASPQAAEAEFLDLNHLVRNTCNLIRYDKRLRGVTLDLQLDTQLNAMIGIADQLTQMIMNLLINATDAMDGVQGREPTITITTAEKDDKIILTIADNGHGIEAEILHRLFDAFFTTKPAGKGTGLGLSLCYSITQKHGGTIHIDSTVNVGTAVRIYFPLAATTFEELS